MLGTDKFGQIRHFCQFRARRDFFLFSFFPFSGLVRPYTFECINRIIEWLRSNACPWLPVARLPSSKIIFITFQPNKLLIFFLFRLHFEKLDIKQTKQLGLGRTESLTKIVQIIFTSKSRISTSDGLTGHCLSVSITTVFRYNNSVNAQFAYIAFIDLCLRDESNAHR